MNETAARGVTMLAGLALVAAACIGSGTEGIPDVLNRYLAAVQQGDLREAYDLTNLKRLAPQPGAALSFAHFEAFVGRNSLDSYQVAKVTRLERRTVEGINEQGTPHYVVDIDLVNDQRTSRQTYTVEGEVLPKVDVEIVQLMVEAPRDVPFLIDGVRTEPGTFGRDDVASFSVLRGRHEVDVDGITFVVDTNPVAIVEGAARVAEDGFVIELAR